MYLLGYLATGIVALSKLSQGLPGIAEFKTEPDFRTTGIETLKISNASAVSPGYIFVTTGKVPQIYDRFGDLVWNGNHTAISWVTDVHVCNYLGESGTHLCYHDGSDEQVGWGLGKIRFFDTTYTQVGEDYGGLGGLDDPDRHELNTPATLRGEAFLQDVFQRTAMDLRDYGGPKNGFVLHNCFQEVNMRTYKPNFQWCSLDHLPIWDTTTFIFDSHNYTHGYGGSGDHEAPWDFFHMNAIDKNEEGDYLISVRHLNSIFKIAGLNNVHGVEPGKILWRLGGQPNERSDFTLQGFNFSRQHAVRFVSTSSSKTRLTLLNNASDGTMNTSSISDGQLIEVNNNTMTARLIKSYVSPDSFVSPSAGMMQTLPNGNVWIGWGGNPAFTEFDADGNAILHGTFSAYAYNPRVWKQPWVGRPLTEPKVLAYAAGCNVREFPVVVYVSWNGATEVTSWRVSARSFTWMPWIPIGSAAKDGFETTIIPSEKASTLMRWTSVLGFIRHIKVEALDNRNTVLSRSETRTWVPAPELMRSSKCDNLGCEGEAFDYQPSFSASHLCKTSKIPFTASVSAILSLLALAILFWRLCKMPY